MPQIRSTSTRALNIVYHSSESHVTREARDVNSSDVTTVVVVGRRERTPRCRSGVSEH